MDMDEGERVDLRLSEQDLAELRRWQRRMIQTFAVAMAGLVGVVVLDMVFQPGEVVGGMMMGVLLIIVVVAARIQFGQKCPACGARLGFQTRLLLPRACRKCGVAFQSDPGA